MRIASRKKALWLSRSLTYTIFFHSFLNLVTVDVNLLFMESNTPEHPIKTNGNEFQKQASFAHGLPICMKHKQLMKSCPSYQQLPVSLFFIPNKNGVFLEQNWITTVKSSRSKIRESGCDRRVSFSSIRQGLGQARTRSPTSASFFVWL